MKYFVGILTIVVGTFMILKTEWMVQNFGRINWAEQYLGTEGGSRLGYKLVGLIFIILAMMGMTGMLGEVILNIFGGLFGIKR